MKVFKIIPIIVLLNMLCIPAIYGNNDIDTLSLFFDGQRVSFLNPHNRISIDEKQDSSIIDVVSNDSVAFVLSISGKTDKYSIRIFSNAGYSLILNGINMTSSQRPLIQSPSSSPVSIELSDGTNNSLIDQSVFYDSASVYKGCIDSYGTLLLSGKGSLKIQSKTRHSIYSKGDVIFSGGNYRFINNNKDGIHTNRGVIVEDGNLFVSARDGDCFESDGPFIMNGGDITMVVSGHANDGIKCRDSLVISGGEIKAMGYGVKKKKTSKVNVSSVLKCTDNVKIKGGDIHIIDYSEGGESIHAGKNVLISDGKIAVINNGFGDFVDRTDPLGKYYTPKCIEAEENVVITGGNVNCLATGTGGKGIVGHEWVVFGVKNDKSFSPIVNVITLGSTLWNDTINDKRYGCPKAIRSGDRMYIYNGTITVFTRGKGGEGLESRNSLFIYGGETMCDTYDDGINVAYKLNMWDGVVYCKSITNDGIDSNGRLTLEGGTLVSLSKDRWGESFDADDSIVVKGGTILGLGRSNVKVSSQSLPLYNTVGNWDDSFRRKQTNLRIQADEYIHLLADEKILLSLRSDFDINDAYLTVYFPNFKQTRKSVLLSSGESIEPDRILFNGDISIGGRCSNERRQIVVVK